MTLFNMPILSVLDRLIATVAFQTTHQNTFKQFLLSSRGAIGEAYRLYSTCCTLTRVSGTLSMTMAPKQLCIHLLVCAAVIVSSYGLADLISANWSRGVSLGARKVTITEVSYRTDSNVN